MKLSELLTKLQHEQVHANSRGEDPEVHVVIDGGHQGCTGALAEEVEARKNNITITGVGTVRW